MSELYRYVAVWGIGVIGTLVTAIALIFNGRIQRLGVQVDNAVSKDQFERRIADLDEQRRAFFSETLRRLDEIARSSQALATQAVELGRLDVRVEQLEEHIQHLIDWTREVERRQQRRGENAPL